VGFNSPTLFSTETNIFGIVFFTLPNVSIATGTLCRIKQRRTMMKFLFTYLILVTGLSSFAQDLKKITKESKSDLTTETYFVLRTNSSIMQGLFTKVSRTNVLLEKGYYNKNKKEGLWIYFKDNPNDTLMCGYFENDNLIGEWKIFDPNGNLSYVYDYSKNELIKYFWNHETRIFKVLKDGNLVEEEIDNPPLIIGDYKPGITVTRLRDSEKADEKGFQGEVMVSFLVDEKGNIVNPRISKGLNDKMDKEALQTLKIFPSKFFPARKNNIPLTVEYEMIIKFEIL